ncbi:MAG: hypothetical protein M3Y60_01610 [Bacteroidota bacterium]|nr:hypothetical protein [Bacteroidota bacterium]
MKLVLIIFALGFLQDIPFKATEEFEAKLDYQFKPRPQGDPNTVSLNGTLRSQKAGSVLPYLIVNIRMLQLPQSKMRVGITTNLNDRPVWRKVNVNGVLELDMGFTDDMIDRVTAYRYTVTFVNDAKEPIDRILINVAEDGSFFVNGEKRGKF